MGFDLFEACKQIVAAHVDEILMQKSNEHFLESFAEEIKEETKRVAVRSGDSCQVIEFGPKEEA